MGVIAWDRMATICSTESCEADAKPNNTRNEKIDPKPTELSTAIEPPIFSTSVFAMARPSPIPVSLAWPSAPLWKGLNTRAIYRRGSISFVHVQFVYEFKADKSTSAALMPLPVSWTENRTAIEFKLVTEERRLLFGGRSTVSKRSSTVPPVDVYLRKER
jgi:hypothetical protein